MRTSSPLWVSLRKARHAHMFSGMPPKAVAGFVTFADSTCQQGRAFSAPMEIFQCVRTLVAEPNRLGNRLFLANVTMPSHPIFDLETHMIWAAFPLPRVAQRIAGGTFRAFLSPNIATSDARVSSRISRPHGDYDWLLIKSKSASLRSGSSSICTLYRGESMYSYNSSKLCVSCQPMSQSSARSSLLPYGFSEAGNPC
jgi:hypothetical protein